MIFAGPGKVALETIPVPKPGPGQVLIETIVSLISPGTELTILKGDNLPGSHWAEYGKYPFVAGYANIGRIKVVGDEGEKGLFGKVAATMTPHARYVLAPLSECYFCPEKTSFDEAAFFTIGEIVMQGIRLARIEPGESVAVFGLGLLGQMAVSLSRFSGGWPVAGVDPIPVRRKMALKSGANYVLDPRKDGFAGEMKKITRDRMFDAVFEVTGNPAVIPGELEFLRQRGRQIILSSPRGKSTLDFHDLVNLPSRIIIGAHNCSHPSVATTYNQWTISRDVELFFDLLSAGKIETKHLITHRYNWQQAPEAYGLLLDQTSGAAGVLLEWAEKSG